MSGPFEGIRVLDLSRLLPGPFCSMLLADLGADVIKVEDPKVGDYIRWWPPKIGANSGFHVVLNRNKRSLTLNLKEPAGRDVFVRLAASADVVLEGFRPGVMDRLGVGYGALREVNPRIIYCAITGYGQDGPRADRAGHDINYLALSGVLSYCGRGGDPVVPGVQIGDLGGGALTAAFSIAAALFWRERTGEGQMIDISMTDGAAAWNCLRWGKFLADGRVPEPGDDLLNHGLACYDVYRTRDGRHMSLGALEPQFWKAFCRVMGRPDWDRPDYFQPGPHQKELRDQVAEAFAGKTQAQWVRIFEAEDCCCEPVLNLAEVLDDEAMRHRRMVVELHHQAWGAYRQMGLAPKFSKTSGEIRTHAPDLGEHTRDVLLEAGYDEGAIEKLRAEGVV
ncbi:Crotonobetainyl-CoA:carnitine CoA-transferase CaiB [Desulfacinum infernum DSM 9756]|uniref:Crotonobetainyl-CoA:carnitine CoA-transferase CaiB n=1 Tax=Desulfacinum infernum DSM 9756 TaxID=1121391 RepID=A0A1M5AE89_9BACT|nr:CaiB/BaiF CoA-transferase family protein [Desulfacinum infernum]SHF28465.1 Crotonobetainyl-CoA:carnitine CoA-transferase CaiB [Desulfacinum infernum DSM 9756]